MRGIACALLLFLLAAAASAEVTMCTDPDPPPWSYWARDKHNNKTAKITGYSVDLMEEIFASFGEKVSVIGTLPWIRCLKMVREGKVDFVLDASYDRERTAHFVYSHHYSTMTPQIFMRTAKPLDIRSVADLKRYHGCGLRGSTYDEYGLKPEDLENSDGEFDTLLRLLKAGHCDYFPEDLEIVAGYRLIGLDALDDPELRHVPVKGASPTRMYIMAGRGSKYAEMMGRIDRKLGELIESGEAARLWAKYAKEIPYTP